MTDADARRHQAQMTASLQQTATVYSGDAYDTPAAITVACRLAQGKAAQAYDPARSTLATAYEVYWDPDVVLAQHDDVQLEIDGTRWNPVSGSFFVSKGGPSGIVVYRKCQVIQGAPTA